MASEDFQSSVIESVLTFFDNEFDLAWFDMLGWVALTGAVFVTNNKSSESALVIVAIFAAVGLFLKIWIALHRFIKACQKHDREPSVNSVWFGILMAYLAPGILLFFFDRAMSSFVR